MKKQEKQKVVEKKWKKGHRKTTRTYIAYSVEEYLNSKIWNSLTGEKNGN